MLLSLLIFILVLSLLVLIHEAGHFFTAKKFGIKVEEFGWGFPPRVFGIKRGETIYSINLLPFGGFVKLYGEDEAGAGSLRKRKGEKEKDKDLERAYFSKPAWQRALVVFAGVVMNTFLAFFIFYVYMLIANFSTVMPLLTNHTFTNVNQQNYNVNDEDVVVSFVSPDSPASQLNLNTPVQITAVDDQKVADRSTFVTYINSHKGEPVELTWKELRTGEVKNGSITPRKNPPKDQGSLGVAFFPIAMLSYDTAMQKAFSGITYSYDLLMYTFDVMGQLIKTSIETGNARPVGESVSGPIGIFSVVGEILKISDMKEKILGLLNLAGALSISLAFFNVLPIPALDGGRLFFILIELVTGKKVNQKYEAMAHAVGLAVLMGLLVLITIFDITKLFR